MMHLSKFAVCVPIILVMCLDLVFTMAGQPDCYWEDYSLCHEASPIGKLLLSIDPMYFVASFVAYAILILVLVIKTPKLISSILAMSAFLGHAWGGASWVPHLYKSLPLAEINGWYLCIGYFVCIAAISSFCCFGNKRKLSTNSG